MDTIADLIVNGDMSEDGEWLGDVPDDHEVVVDTTEEQSMLQSQSIEEFGNTFWIVEQINGFMLMSELQFKANLKSETPLRGLRVVKASIYNHDVKELLTENTNLKARITELTSEES